jgi:hypothetical protein
MNNTELKTLIENLDKNDYSNDFRFTCGNCAAFAIALRELLDKGELYHIVGDNGNTDIYHEVLSLNNGKTFIDGEGEHTKRELKLLYPFHPILKENRPDSLVLNWTGRNVSVPIMTEIIKNLASNNHQKALTIYKRNCKHPYTKIVNVVKTPHEPFHSNYIR